MFRVCHVVFSVHRCLVTTCLERADLLAFVCNILLCFVTFPCGILGQVWYSILKILTFATFLYFVTSYGGLGSLKTSCELNMFVLHQQQNLERTFGTSKMHLSLTPFAKAAVRSKAVVLLLLISTPILGSCNRSMFLCVTLFTYLLTSFLQIDVRLKQSASKTPTI